MANTTATSNQEAKAYKSVDTGSANGQPRVLITGMGCITPLGTGVDSFWSGLLAGRSGIGPLTSFDPTPYGTKIAGEVRDFKASDFLSQREISGSARCVHFALASARMAIDDARLPLQGVDTSRTGVFIGTSVGPIAYQAENHAIFLEKGIRESTRFSPRSPILALWLHRSPFPSASMVQRFVCRAPVRRRRTPLGWLGCRSARG